MQKCKNLISSLVSRFAAQQSVFCFIRKQWWLFEFLFTKKIVFMWLVKSMGRFFLNQLEFVLFSNEFAASFPNGNVTEKIRL